MSPFLFINISVCGLWNNIINIFLIFVQLNTKEDKEVLRCYAYSVGHDLFDAPYLSTVKTGKPRVSFQEARLLVV